MATKTQAKPPVEAPREAPREEPREETASEFLARVRRVVSMDGNLQPVKCDLPGYTGVTVYFNVDNQHALAKLLTTIPAGLPTEDLNRLWALFMRRFEGRPDGATEDVEWPTPDKPESYSMLWDQMGGFGSWCRWEGYERAKEERWGNSSVRLRRISPAGATSK